MNIAILTNFQDFNPGYSLTGIVRDQVTMLLKHGHRVHVFTCENFNPKFPLPDGAEIRQVVPFGHLIDYSSKEQLKENPDHKKLIAKTRDMLVETFTELKIDIAFSHDWLFTGWNFPYGSGIREASPFLPNVRWLHWVHSIPSTFYDWWEIKGYGPNHKLVFPNETDRLRVAEQFRGELDDVRVIPHIKDLRTWYEFSSETKDFIDDHPGVMQADFVQIYPASCDRLFAKRVEIVTEIMAGLKRKGFTVCLVVANQWATGRAPRENIDKYIKFAESVNMQPGTEFIFTSEWRGENYVQGISHRFLRELNLCSNLFVFPTREESFGLVGPEAALAGCFMVLNKSLGMMHEIFGNNGLYFDFGSYYNNVEHEKKEEYMDQVSAIILGRCLQNESFKTKSYCRLMYNYDYLYDHIYYPIMLESQIWGGKKGVELEVAQ